MVQVRIDGNTIRGAKAVAKRRRAKEVVYRDTAERGLAIRVRYGSASWWWIHEKGKVPIGSVETIGDDKLPLLRELVQRMKQAVKDGRNPAHLVTEVFGVGETDLEEAEKKAEVREGAWIWEDLRNKYLDHVKKSLSAKTHQGHRNALAHMEGSVLAKDFEPIAGKPIRSITANQILAVVNSILGRGCYQQSRLSHAAIRGAFKWGFGQVDANLEMNVSLMVPPPRRPSVSKDDVSAKATAVGILASPREICEFGFKWIWDEYECDDRVRRATQLQILTGQRIASVIQSHSSEFVRTPGLPWKYVWALGPDKTMAYRLLPLPPAASFIVHQALSSPRDGQENNRYLFPQLKRAKMAKVKDGHLSYEATKNAWDDARKLNNGPLPSRFTGGHDLRRAFVTHLSDWKKLGFESKDSVRMVTHADEGRSTVAQKIYDYDEHLEEKFRVLSAYERIILYSLPGSQYDEEYHERLWELSDS
jgi:integrase